MTTKEDSLSPLAGTQVDMQSWPDRGISTMSTMSATTDNNEDMDEMNDGDQFPELIDDHWRELLKDPNKRLLSSEISPMFEALEKQNREMKTKMAIMKSKLRQTSDAHRNSVIAIHNKMFKKIIRCRRRT